MKKILLLTLVMALGASGCFWPFAGTKDRGGRTAADDGVSVEILNAASAGKIRSIYFEPFSAGTRAQAGEDLDRLALMIVKGFSDACEKEGRCVLLPGSEASRADAVMTGHIEEFEVRGHFKKTALMSIRADLRAASDNDVVALIYARRSFRDKGKSSDQAAYDMGYAVAQKFLE